MKNTILILIPFLLISCAGNGYLYKGERHSPKGAFTTVEMNPCLKYKVVKENIYLGALLLPTIVGPVYFWGFSYLDPVGVKQKCERK